MNRSPEELVRIIWLAWLVSWIAAAGWSSRTQRRPGVGQETLYRLLTLVGASLLFWLKSPWTSLDRMVWQPGRESDWFLVAPLVFGLAFTCWARIVLGRLWSGSITRKTDHSVITAGPYGLVRHPIYSGLILAVFATAAIRGTASAYLGAGLVTLGLFVKARVEEGFLRRELGEEQYDRYAQHVPMLVPFLR